jgi:hypothetical protein
MSKSIRQTINYAGKSLMHSSEPELTIEEMSVILGIPQDRIHKTFEVQFHIHDATNEELNRIKGMTLGEARGRLI